MTTPDPASCDHILGNHFYKGDNVVRQSEVDEATPKHLDEPFTFCPLCGTRLIPEQTNATTR
jgi:hypothetical protein